MTQALIKRMRDKVNMLLFQNPTLITVVLEAVQVWEIPMILKRSDLLHFYNFIKILT
jgi:hypothetical protein